eukprot:gene8970-biopygen8853
MRPLPHVPSEVVADIVLRALRLEAPICDMSVVCRSWHSIVMRNLAEVLMLRELRERNGSMVSVLRCALKHHKLDVALDLVSKPGSLEESAEALVLVARYGNTELARCLMHAPQNAANADCQDGEALVEAAFGGHIEHAARANCGGGVALVGAADRGHTEVVCMLLDAPQHAAHADCRGGKALKVAALGGHIEVVRLLLDAPQHAAHADYGGGVALVEAAAGGHIEVVRLLLDAPQHAAHAACLGGAALVRAADGGHTEVVSLLKDRIAGQTQRVR